MLNLMLRCASFARNIFGCFKLYKLVALNKCLRSRRLSRHEYCRLWQIFFDTAASLQIHLSFIDCLLL